MSPLEFHFFAPFHTTPTRMVNVASIMVRKQFWQDSYAVLKKSGINFVFQHTAPVLPGELDIPLQVAVDNAYQVLKVQIVFLIVHLFRETGFSLHVTELCRI